MDIFQKPNDITVNLLLCDHRTHRERFLISSAIVTNVDGDVLEVLWEILFYCGISGLLCLIA